MCEYRIIDVKFTHAYLKTMYHFCASESLSTKNISKGMYDLIKIDVYVVGMI